MNINTQLHLITYFFIGLLVLLGLFALVGWFVVSTLSEQQKWVNRTNEHLELIEMTERLFNEADYQGRLRLSDGVESTELPDNREKVLVAVETLKSKVADNPAQVVRCDSLLMHIRQRFDAQDAQFRGRKANGTTVEFDRALVAQNSEFLKTIEILFYNLQINEFNVQRLEQMPRLYSWQWNLVYFSATVWVLLLLVASALFHLIRRILKRNLRVGRKMDETLHNGDIADLKKLARQVEKFRDAILENNDPLTS